LESGHGKWPASAAVTGWANSQPEPAERPNGDGTSGVTIHTTMTTVITESQAETLLTFIMCLVREKTLPTTKLLTVYGKAGFHVKSASTNWNFQQVLVFFVKF